MNYVHQLLSTQYAYKQNLSGKDICVAVLDTGISYHKDFLSHTQSRIIAFYDCINNQKNAYDDNGHGTHVASIIGGNGLESNGLYSGIAPNCNIISIKILNSKGNGNVVHLKKALEWIIDNKKRHNIKIVNLSVGSPISNCTNNRLLLKYVNEAWDNGLTIVTAAGNLGPKDNTITVPGTSSKVITVSTLEDNLNCDHCKKRICHPSKGSIYSSPIKPDILAPGNNICACNINKGYTIKSGTSMSAPIISGTLALFFEKNPSLTNEDAKSLLHKTAINLKKPKNRQGYGLVNIPHFLNSDNVS